MSENRFGLYADCIRTILVTPSSSSDFQNVEIARDLLVDTNTLYVDSMDNRVGINTLTPTTTLQYGKKKTQVAGSQGIRMIRG